MPLRYRNIIFDFDGTLVDSKRDIAGAQLRVLHHLGVHTHQPEDLFRHIGKPLDETFRALLPASLHHRIDEAAELYAEYYIPRSLVTTTLFPGVKDTLKDLVGAGCRLAIASTKKGGGIHRVTEHFGITGNFVQLQGSDGLPFKPDPAILWKILADQHWNDDASLMVGDTDKDILAGKRAGLATCAVTYGSLTADELRRYSPDFCIDRFRDLLAAVHGDVQIPEGRDAYESR